MRALRVRGNTTARSRQVPAKMARGGHTRRRRKQWDERREKKGCVLQRVQTEVQCTATDAR